MKDYARNVDELGRIVIPKEIRRANNIDVGDLLAVRVIPDGILLTPAKAKCAICGSVEDLITADNITICRLCGARLKEALK